MGGSVSRARQLPNAECQLPIAEWEKIICDLRFAIEIHQSQITNCNWQIPLIHSAIGIRQLELL